MGPQTNQPDETAMPPANEGSLPTPAVTPPATTPGNQPTENGAFVSAPFSDNTTPTPTTPVGGSGGAKRKIPLAVLVVGIVVVLLGGGAAAYFSTIVANKPENVWSKAMENTNKGYTKLVEYAKKNKDNKGAAIDGTFKIDAASTVVDGTIKGKAYDKDLDATLDIGAAGTRVNFNILSHVPDNSKYPDVYIKANGLAGLGKLMGGSASDTGKLLTSFDNQWYSIDHTLFDQLQKQAGTANANAASLTQDDLYGIADAIGRVNAEYLFTDNKDKAVLQVNQNVGKETLDKRSTYHYKVGYNKDNLKKYVTAMKDELNKTKVKELVPEQNLDKALNFDELLKSIDKLDGKRTADAWVDLDTKLIRKIRFTEENKPDNYVDLFLNYNGGDNYPFGITLHSKDNSEEANGSITATLNTKQNTVNYVADLKITGSNPVTANLSFNVKQSNEKIEFKKPDGVKSLTDLLGGLFGGGVPAGGTGSELQGLEQLQL